MNMYACVCLILFYVQDLMGEDRNGAQVWELIHNQKGYFYVCGGANMGQQIKLRVIKLAEKYVCVCLLYSQ
jgi:sulfite reductase alpha subunit-like flavoprotein